jgi:hypothetical protein
MLGETNGDFYCTSADYNELSGNCMRTANQCVNCSCKKHKYPTPEQFREEYGKEYPDDGAVYCFMFDGEGYSWWVLAHEYAKQYLNEYPIICACTPWGKPPDDWRPE